MAERGGFEPPRPEEGLPHFECGAFNRSAIFPHCALYYRYFSLHCKIFLTLSGSPLKSAVFSICALRKKGLCFTQSLFQYVVADILLKDVTYPLFLLGFTRCFTVCSCCWGGSRSLCYRGGNAAVCSRSCGLSCSSSSIRSCWSCCRWGCCRRC